MENISIAILFSAINNATPVFNKVNSGVKGITDGMWKANQIAELWSKTSETMSRIARPGIEFDFGLKEFSSITGLAGQELTDLGKVARQVGKESGIGATASLNAFKILASQLDFEKMGVAGLTEIQKMAVVLGQANADLGMEGAANALAGTINQFGLAATDAERVANVLAAGSKVAGAEIPHLAASFQAAGSTAAAAGLSVEQTAGILEVLSGNMSLGAEAGTRLRNILLGFQTKMGIDFNTTSFSQALNLVNQELGKIEGSQAKNEYLLKIFNVADLGDLQYLLKNTQAVDEYTQAVTGTKTATEQAAIMNDTFAHRMDVLRAKLNDFAIGVFSNNQGIFQLAMTGGQFAQGITTLVPAFAAVGGGIAGAFSATARFSRAFGLLNMAIKAGNISAFSGIVARYGTAGKVAATATWMWNRALGAATWAGRLFNAETRTAMLLQLRQATASKIQAAWTWIAGKAQLVASGITALWGKRMIVTGAIQAWWSRGIALSGLTLKGLRGAFIGVIAQTWAWTAALWANPITWIIAAIIALVAGIALAWKHFDWFRGGIIGAWEAIKKFGQILWESIINPIKMIIGGVGKLIDAFKLFKKGDMAGAREALKGGLGDIGKGMVQSTPIGVAMNVVKRRDEIGQAWNSGYEKGKAIDTSNFLDFGSMFNRGQEQTVQPANLQVPDIDLNNMQMPGFQADPNYDFTGWDLHQKKLDDIERRKQVAEQLHKEGKIPEKGNYSTSPASINNSIVNNDYLEQLTRNIATNTTNQHSQDNRESRIEVNYQPQVHISADLTRESQDNLLKMLNVHKDQLMKLIKEELRKEGRLAYAG